MKIYGLLEVFECLVIFKAVIVLQAALGESFKGWGFGRVTCP